MYRHLMKAKKLYVYVVVFVAFVNACFFMPMHVQASGIISSDYTAHLYLGSGTSSDAIVSLDANTYASSYAYDKSPVSGRYSPQLSFSISSDDFSKGNYFTLEFTISFGVNISSGGSINGGNYYSSFYVFSPIFGFHEYGEIDDNSTVIVDDDYSSMTYGNNYISMSTRGTRIYKSGDFGYNVEISYLVSGSYNDIGFLGFVFEPYCDLSGSGYGWLMISLANVKLTISGSSVSDSQNLQDLVDGYNDSAGNQAASDFGNSASGYEQAEDNLFQGSESSLSGFQFFDFSGFTGITTGLSFVSSMLVSIYNNFGGMSGIGIVISVLFSVMFLAIVIGLYRYFK